MESKRLIDRFAEKVDNVPRDFDPSRIKLFLCDLDGTLLDSEAMMHPDNIDAIKKLRRRGIKFSIATGRMMSAAMAPLTGLDIDFPIITLNGCFIGDPEIHHQPIENHYLESIMPAIENIKATAVAMKKDSAYLMGHEHIEQKALSNWISNIEYIDKFGPEHIVDTTEFLVTGDKDVIDEFHEYASSLLDGKAYVVSFPSTRYVPLWYSEIRSLGVDKGTSLRILRDHYGYSPDEVFVVGDYLNDIELFDEAGFSAAPANAREEILEKADFISPFTNDECAVVKIIEKFFG